jgi:hypothetical protein
MDTSNNRIELTTSLVVRSSTCPPPADARASSPAGRAVQAGG